MTYENGKTYDDSNIGLELGQTTAKGVTALFSSKLAGKVVALIGSIILIRLLQLPSAYGLISAATLIPGLASLGDVSGVFSALNRYLSEYKHNKEYSQMWSMFWTALSVEVLTGAVLTMVAFLISDPISVLIGKPAEAPFFRLASFLTFAFIVQSVDLPVMLSMNRSGLYAQMQVVYQILLSFAPIIPVLFGYGAIGALYGLVIGNFVFMSIEVALSIKIIYVETTRSDRILIFYATVKKMIRFGFPLGVSGSLTNSFGTVVSLVIVKFVTIATYGLYSVASSAVLIVGYVTYPINTLDFTILSRLQSTENKELLGRVYELMIKYSSALILPASLFFALFAGPILVLLYGTAYAAAGIMLSIITISMMEYPLGTTTTTTLLASHGYTGLTGKLNILSAIVSFLIAIALLPTVGFYAFLFASSVFSTIPIFLIATWKAKQQLGMSPPFLDIERLYLATLCSAAVTVFAIFPPLPPLVTVLIGGVTILISFPVFSVVVRAINHEDIMRITKVFSAQRTLSKLLTPFLTLLDRFIRLVNR